MKEKNLFKNLIEKIEYYIPMTFSSLLMLLFILYLFFIDGRMMISNYNSNQGIADEAKEVEKLDAENYYLKNQIAYFQTDSFKEKEARAKLAYKAPGERVIALSIDKIEDKSENVVLEDKKVKEPNYVLWKKYFFGE